MYQVFKDQLEKSKILLVSVKRNHRMGRHSGASDALLQNLEDDCKRVEALSAELERLREELHRKTDETHAVLDQLKEHTKQVKKAVKRNYDQTWWSKFGIHDKR